MSKRPCPFGDGDQARKQQVTSETTSRKIRSASEERTLQLLYQGARLKRDVKTNDSSKCVECTIISLNYKCAYCDRPMCRNCMTRCSKCSEFFCKNCYFTLCEPVCISCY